MLPLSPAHWRPTGLKQVLLRLAELFFRNQATPASYEAFGRVLPAVFAGRSPMTKPWSSYKGRTTVVMDSGQEISIEPGVMAFVGRGQSSTWTIHDDVRKAFHADSPEPLPF